MQFEIGKKYYHQTYKRTMTVIGLTGQYVEYSYVGEDSVSKALKKGTFAKQFVPVSCRDEEVSKDSFMLFVPGPYSSSPKVIHSSYEKAEREAVRLISEEKVHKILILKAIAEVKPKAQYEITKL